MEDLVAELLGGKDNRWDGTVRQALEKWTVSLVCPSFLKQMETIMKTPFKTPGQGPSFRLLVSSPTPASIGTDIQETPEVSGSIRFADKGTETTSLVPRVTRSATKQTLGSSPRPKRAYVSPSKGSSSKRRR